MKESENNLHLCCICFSCNKFECYNLFFAVTTMSSMRAPLNGRKKSKKIGAPAWVKPDGKYVPGCWARFRFSPYGEGGMSTYAREIVGGLMKEMLLVMIISFILPAVVSIAPGADAFSRAFYIGFIASVSLYGALNISYNSRLPRLLSPGAVVSELCRGYINWLLAVLMLIAGFVGATIGALLLLASGGSAIPIIGGANPTSIGGAFVVQFLVTMAIAYSVLDQKTTRRGEPKMFPKDAKRPGRDEVSTNENPLPYAAYNENLAKRPIVYAAFIWFLVTFSFAKFGLWTFNGYIYYAGALGLQLLGIPDTFNNNATAAATNVITGVAALFILTDVLAWLVAAALDWLMYYLQNNEWDRSNDASDESNYGGIGDQYELMEEEYESIPDKKKKSVNTSTSSRRNINDAAVIEHLNANDWVGE